MDLKWVVFMLLKWLYQYSVDIHKFLSDVTRDQNHNVQCQCAYNYVAAKSVHAVMSVTGGGGGVVVGVAVSSVYLNSTCIRIFF